MPALIEGTRRNSRYASPLRARYAARLPRSLKSTSFPFTIMLRKASSIEHAVGIRTRFEPAGEVDVHALLQPGDCEHVRTPGTHRGERRIPLDTRGSAG